MRYVSLFSGVEAATLAWGPLGWEAMAFCEVDPFPCAVLAHRYPEVPNLGDVREVDWGGFIADRGRPDVVVGGSPCQCTVWRGEYWTRSSSEWPSAAAVCSLSGCLETRPVPARYFLSERACLGILRRAERRGKSLPPELDAALRRQAGLPSR